MTALRPRFVQARKTTLQSSITDTETGSIVLKSLVDIYGNQLAITDFVPLLYLTIDPAGANEEVISCSGFTVNADGTVTLDTGIVRGLAVKYAYGAGGTAHDHAAGVVAVISDQPQLVEAILAYVEDVAISGSPNASQTSKGIMEVATAAEITAGTSTGSTGALLAISPDQLVLSIYGTRLPSADEKAALAGDVGSPSVSNKYLTEQTTKVPPVGIISPYAGFAAPSGWLLADGTAVSRSTYAALFALLNPSLGTATMSIATPAVVSLTTHGLVLDDIIYFTTTGALPTGVTANTRYYVIAGGLTADAFEFSASKGGAAVNTSGSQSGVHTLHRSPYGVGDGSTTFNVPNLKGSVPVGRDSTQTEFNAVGETGGEKTHQLTVPEMPSHNHTGSSGNSGGGTKILAAGGSSATYTSDSTGGDGAHNNLQPYIALNYIIKT